MAVTKTVLIVTDSYAVVKVAGSGAAATIDLQTDLLKSNEVLDGTQRVEISGVQWSGAQDGVITITRNDVVVMTLQANATGSLDMGGVMITPDHVGNSVDIVVTISGAQAECWLRLRKSEGYKSKVEPSLYGEYDDPARVGASTTKRGSPDYVAP
jgi:hypothetical protein